MKTRRVVAGAVAAAALAGGTAGAVAATTDEKAAEQAVLGDAAKRLGVTTDELRSALAAAQDAQLDAAVKAGDLTQEQADAIKARRDAEGTVLGLGRGRFGDHHGFGRRGGPWGGPLADEIATALGISPERLFEQLRNGRTLEQIATAEGKTLEQVRAAVKAAVTERLDAALVAGRITQAQYDEMVEHLGEHIARLGEEPAFRGGRGRGPGFWP
ncbi:MAG TPA: hypothetical protein VN213_10800 [Solirubrobacteraceae bacterium]|nr:hypothetical protein [Solirubrobacteraceae bacterium]